LVALVQTWSEFGRAFANELLAGGAIGVVVMTAPANRLSRWPLTEIKTDPRGSSGKLERRLSIATKKEGGVWSKGEKIHEIAHLGRVELLTPTPERSLWYFGDLLGMQVVHRGPSAVYLPGIR
jgi:hypothetical protein